MVFQSKPDGDEQAATDDKGKAIDKKSRKQGQALLKGVAKFLRYNDDLISSENREQIDSKYAAFASSLESETATRGEAESLAQELTDKCKSSVRNYSASAWKENIEVFFVAIVIAMGIRAYFIQQFKIPTGSMQPTLNGIIGYPTKEMNPGNEYQAPDDYTKPGFPKRMWDKFWYGRSHVDWISAEDDVIVLSSRNFYDKTHFLFFPRTYLISQNGQVFKAPGTRSRVETLLNQQLSRRGLLEINAGERIAQGFVDTGDQLVVNKFIYHWKKPERGEVFVFTTENITGIQVDPREGSQHYIKRLVGLPGDALSIEPPLLKINGEVAQEPGMARVMSQEGHYAPGYVISGVSSRTMKEAEYFAMGDNSDNSGDSRNWGPVPERNIVGRAAFVYYPFGHHFGKID